MHPTFWRALFWTPRILTLAFVFFLAIFALDVFGQGLSFLEAVLALFIHLIPNFLLLAILLVAWRWEWIGAVLFAGLAVFYFLETWGRFHWATYTVISGTLAILAILFLLNWIFHDRVRVARPGVV